MTTVAGLRFIMPTLTSSIGIPAHVLIYGTSHYSPAQSTVYVKATSNTVNYAPDKATDPLLSLTGTAAGNSWRGGAGQTGSQRFHIDLGNWHTINRIYYQNYSDVLGLDTDSGVKDFTFWGSNVAAAFANTTYATDTDWTQLATSVSAFERHSAADVEEPKYIEVTNTAPFRYYAFKIATNWGNGSVIGVRRLELQRYRTSGRIYQVTIQPFTNPVHVCWDGADADITGLTLAAGDMLTLQGYENITQLRIVDTAAGAATLHVIPEYRM